MADKGPISKEQADIFSKGFNKSLGFGRDVSEEDESEKRRKEAQRQALLRLQQRGASPGVE